MTAYEIKAKELIEKFTHGGLVNWEAAKKDAIICCQVCYNELDRISMKHSAKSLRREYWQKVNEAIESM